MDGAGNVVSRRQEISTLLSHNIQVLATALKRAELILYCYFYKK